MVCERRTGGVGVCIEAMMLRSIEAARLQLLVSVSCQALPRATFGECRQDVQHNRISDNNMNCTIFGVMR